MTLDEAIQHCKDEAHVLFQHSAKHRTGTEDSCYECAKEHEQLAEWLTELKEKRCKVIVQESRIKELEGELKEALAKRAEAYDKLYAAYAKIDELILAKEEQE